jgi:hypothetical protein
MKFEVWHAKQPTFDAYTREDSPFNPNRRRQRFPQDYAKVAVVETESVDDVFGLTNHIDHDWTLNPQVVEVVPGGQRPTSVGDVVVTPEGKKMYCDSVGWKEIE